MLVSVSIVPVMDMEPKDHIVGGQINLLCLSPHGIAGNLSKGYVFTKLDSVL